MAGKDKGKGPGNQSTTEAKDDPFNFDVNLDDNLSLVEENDDVDLEFGAPVASADSGAKPPTFSGDDEFADILSDESLVETPAAPPPPPAPAARSEAVAAKPTAPVARPEPAAAPAASAMPAEDDFGSEEPAGFGEAGDPFQDDVFGEEDIDLAGVPPLPGEKPVQSVAQRRNADAEFGDIGDDAPGRDVFDDHDALTQASEAGFEDEEEETEPGNAFEDEVEEVEIVETRSGGNRAVKVGVYVMMAMLLAGTAYIGYTTVLPMFVGQSTPVVDAGPVIPNDAPVAQLPAFPPVAEAPQAPAPVGVPDLTVVSPGPQGPMDNPFGGNGQVAEIPGMTGPLNGAPVVTPAPADAGTILGGPIVDGGVVIPPSGQTIVDGGTTFPPEAGGPVFMPDTAMPTMPGAPTDVAPIREAVTPDAAPAAPVTPPVVVQAPVDPTPVVPAPATVAGDDASILASIRDEIALVRQQGDALATRLSSMESNVERISQIESRLAGIEKRVEEAPAPVAAGPARPTPAPARVARAEPERERAKPAERRRAPQADARRDNPPRHNRKFNPADKPPLVSQYTLSGISSGRAVVKSAAGFQEVGVGTVLPGAGRVQAIRNVGGDWVVTTENGVIVR